MKIIKSILEATEYCSELKNKGSTIASINTGGDLHEGHMHLVSAARNNADIVIVMIDFPYEYFNMSKDAFNKFSKNYERNILKKDIKLCLENKVDIFFAPTMWDMYGKKTTKIGVSNGFLKKSIWNVEHIMSFIKDYNILKTDITVLGQKDIHQTMSMIGIINALNFSVKPLIVPTQRDSDGLAFSSRNRFLTKVQRERALSVYKSLQEVAELTSYPPVKELRRKIFNNIKNAHGSVCHVEITCAETMAPLDVVDRPTVVIASATFDKVTVWDNILINA